MLGRDIVFHVTTVVCFSAMTMSRQMFPCCDRDGHDKRSGVATEVSLGQGFYVVTKYFVSRQNLVKAKGFYVVTENFCVTTEFPGVVS